MDETWFEDELLPSEGTIENTVKHMPKGDADLARQALRKDARGEVRVAKPRWQLIEPAERKLLTSGGDARFYMVRLAFEFALDKDAGDKSINFVYARCAAYLRAAQNGQPQPSVYEVIPRDLYDGEQRKVSVKLGPEIKLDKVGASLGEASTDFAIGTVEPAVVGYTGKDEREPYWELRPKSKSLVGLRHLWLVVEVPAACEGFRLAARAEGDIQVRFGPIPVGPKVREWGERPSILIA